MKNWEIEGDMNQIFIKACIHNKPIIAHYIAKRYNINVTQNDNMAFIKACKNNSLDTVKWLVEYSIPMAIITKLFYELLMEPNIVNDSKLLEFLVETFPKLNIYAHEHLAFQQACDNNSDLIIPLMIRSKESHTPYFYKNNIGFILNSMGPSTWHTVLYNGHVIASSKPVGAKIIKTIIDEKSNVSAKLVM